MIASMTEGFTKEERDRFHKLLVLANDGSFAGEREAALAAARRMAERHGMTLEEAARDRPGADESPHRSTGNGYWQRRREEEAAFNANLHQAWHPHDANSAAASRARQRAVWDQEEAERDSRRAGQTRRRSARSPRGMPPLDHARVLIQETRFPLVEISRITGVSLHKLVGLKLKLRPVSTASGAD
jgi:hypothetical protein